MRSGSQVAQVMEAGQGSQVLFLHGTFGMPWDPFLDLLSQNRQVVAPVHPGFRDVDAPESLSDLNDLVVYYLDLLDELKLHRVPVVGHSFGGMIAAELAAIQPDRFTCLVLISPLGLWNQSYPVADFFAVEPKDLPSMLFYDPVGALERKAINIPEQGPAMIAFMLERARSMATAARFLWPIPDKGLRKRIHRIAAPTLLVWGRGDRVCPPEYAQEFRGLISDSQVEMIEKAGHMVHLEQPRALADAVTRFLEANGY